MTCIPKIMAKRPVFWHVLPEVRWRYTGASDEHVASIFRLKLRPDKIPARNKQSTSCCLLHACYLLKSLYNLKMEATCSSKTLANFQWTTRRYTADRKSMGWEWVHLVLRPLFGLLYQPQMRNDDDCGAIGGMRIDTVNRSTSRKFAPVPLGPPQIPHDLTRSRTRATAVGSRRLTAWLRLTAIFLLITVQLEGLIRRSYRKSWATFFCMQPGNSRRKRVRW
jgi:hypothetical protein